MTKVRDTGERKRRKKVKPRRCGITEIKHDMKVMYYVHSIVYVTLAG